jgi:4-carboxymuconolactone decarboxylase
MKDMTENTEEPSGAQKAFGDFALAFVDFTDDVLFGQVWTRPELSPKERSLITVAALTAGGNTEQLTFHLGLARQNGATETELIEAITHLAFYTGWPKAMSAMAVAKQVFRSNCAATGRSAPSCEESFSTPPGISASNSARTRRSSSPPTRSSG